MRLHSISNLYEVAQDFVAVTGVKLEVDERLKNPEDICAFAYFEWHLERAGLKGVLTGFAAGRNKARHEYESATSFLDYLLAFLPTEAGRLARGRIETDLGFWEGIEIYYAHLRGENVREKFKLESQNEVSAEWVMANRFFGALMDGEVMDGFEELLEDCKELRRAKRNREIDAVLEDVKRDLKLLKF